MSIYFDSKIVIPDSTNYGLGKRIFLDVDWHKTQPLLAISHSDEKHGATVSVYDHTKDETVNTDSTPQPGVQITGLSWHPTERILAIGYETGEVVIWNHDEHEVFEGARGHNSAVMLMEWSYDGTVLVSSDNMGILIIWKSDLQGHLQTQAIHDFKDPVCHIVFRQRNKISQRDDQTQRALGMMTSWRPKTGRNRGEGMTGRKLSNVGDELSDEKCFFVGVLSGTIYYLKENGSSEEILSSGSTIRSLLYFIPKDILIVMTEAQIMGQFRIDPGGDLKEINKMKISGNGEMRLFWVGTNTLAVIGKDPYVRLWDVESGKNTVLEPVSSEVSEDETFLSIDYHPKDGILCCCTNKGKLVMWKEVESPFSDDGECRQTEDTHWESHGITPVPTSSKTARFCKNFAGLMVVNAIQDIIILKEHQLNFYYGNQVSVVQMHPNQLSINMLEHRKVFDIKVDIQIKGLSASGAHVVIWNGSKVIIYEFGPQLSSNYKYAGSFATKADSILVHGLSLYMQETGHIQVRTFQGTIKQTMNFTQEEGPPITMAVGGDYFTSGSEYGYLKIWHIGRREAKLHTSPKNLNECVKDLGEIISANTNYNGSKVAFVVAKPNLVPDSRLFVMDITTSLTQEISFPNRFIEKFFWDVEDASYIAVEIKMLSKELQALAADESYQQLMKEEQSAASQAAKENASKKKTSNKRPRFLFGDEEDKETKATKRFPIAPKRRPLKNQNANQLSINLVADPIDFPDEVDHAVVSLFADTEKGFLVHEKRTELNGKDLVGLQVPYFYMAQNGVWNQKKPKLKDTKDLDKNRSSLQNMQLNSLKLRIEKEIIPEFEGVEDENTEGKTALMKYVYHTLFNDVDGALRSIRGISNVKVYSNMLRNCVKTKRMDIALHCLAKMKDARMAREIRLAMDREPEPEAHAAMLAIHLGLIDDAQRLYTECKRYDLLLELYVICEWWDKAISLCEKHRRIQLRSTYHAYAKSLEVEKKFLEAIEMYEKAETHRYEVPRMLVDDPDQLQAYVVKKKDKELYQWWAQYLESSGDVESALRYYELSHDWLSLVRLLCYLGNYEKAVKMTEKAEDKASAYHLARTLEDKGEVNKAISFYSRAGAYGHAMRMCKEHNMMDDLWRMALKAEPAEQAEAAKYFETVDPPMFDKAIQLYHKAGYDSKALELAFSAQEFSALQLIVRDIMNQPNVNTDPMLLQKCADFFVQNNEIDKALDMLCAAQKYPEAMELCVDHNFTITDEIAERLTAPKGIGLEERTRISLLEKMGECCTLQGSYHLAAKKFTQAGNKIEAIKSLIKSGDTDRIIFYANKSRHREIYMIAANYLQTTDWRKNAKIIQMIAQYYTKAQAFDSVAGFYENVAESEIEDSRDYKSALEAYRKAEATLQDLVSCGARQYEDQHKLVQSKIEYVNKFLAIKDNMKSDSEAAMQDLNRLIQDPKSDLGVRTGDLYGLIVEHYVNQGEIKQALTVIEEMRKFISNQNITKFLSPETITKIEQATSNTSIFRVKSGEKARTKQFKSSGLPPTNQNQTATSPLSSLPFLNKSFDDMIKQYQNGNTEGDDGQVNGDEDDEEEDDEDLEEEEEVEDLEDEEDVVNVEQVEEEEESDEDEELGDFEKNKNPYNPTTGFFTQAQAYR